MATTKHRQSSISTQEDDTNLYSDVDEIFTKLDISQIHQLNKKYRNIIDDTKSNLHDLVGSKYRDLIKIAEDIGDIYQHSSDIDLKVQQLSYKPTKFISIYLDNYGKFDSYMRKQNALQSQKDSRSIIVRNVKQLVAEAMAVFCALQQVQYSHPNQLLHQSFHQQ